MAIEIFNEMLGHTVTEVTDFNNEMIFKTSKGKTFKFLHYQDCCENVCIEDVCGDLDDLIGSPFLIAEEVDNLDAPVLETGESYQWTFYRFGTSKGTVTVRWLGISSSYSTSVSLEIS